ncbi:hypothetical protein F4553_001524 [Allocatelliglobosispora scoriae]|uniref:Methylamine utilisation protein MauE domain-containing protein n=1 Tax=Allocatelliglobosispora scoriae TaxID=643052 RepID=A0A841BKH8_9ACTN|nr:MauE/DoxX family redox-associated membrane protein [Allocatelliglobosispora scoriae]MBB5868145.1 hypothetical protein [Allocatelliglobosispora scoriae]
MPLWVASVQPLLIAAVLLWAGVGKLAGRQSADAARRSALAQLLGPERAVPAYTLVGFVEVALGAALALPPAPRAEAAVAAALHVGFLAYLGYAKVAAPESSCGCLSAQRAPVRWRGFARAGLLLLAALAALTTTEFWLAAATEHPLAATVLLLAEAAAVVALSAELDGYWLVPLRRLKVRLTHPLPTGSFEVPIASTVEQLHRSGVYRRIADLIESDVREHWDEGEWRIVCFTARYQGRVGSAVFAVPRLSYQPGAVRVAIVDEETREVLLSLNPIPDPVAEAGWPVPAPA